MFPAVLICVCQAAYTVLVFVLPDRSDYFDKVCSVEIRRAARPSASAAVGSR